MHSEGQGSTDKQTQMPNGNSAKAQSKYKCMANSSLEFPIGDITGEAPMKSIPFSTLPNFYGRYTKDTNTFLFEFDIVYHGYDYISDSHKLKIFLATLKGTTLRWFMGLGGKDVTT